MDASQAVGHPARDSVQLVFDPAEVIAAMGQRIQALYPQAFITSAPELPEAFAFAHLLADFVPLADWLNSDTREGF